MPCPCRSGLTLSGLKTSTSTSRSGASSQPRVASTCPTTVPCSWATSERLGRHPVDARKASTRSGTIGWAAKAACTTWRTRGRSDSRSCRTSTSAATVASCQPRPDSAPHFCLRSRFCGLRRRFCGLRRRFAGCAGASAISVPPQNGRGLRRAAPPAGCCLSLNWPVQPLDSAVPFSDRLLTAGFGWRWPARTRCPCSIRTWRCPSGRRRGSAGSELAKYPHRVGFAPRASRWSPAYYSHTRIFGIVAPPWAVGIDVGIKVGIARPRVRTRMR
jgi:hypothetical protein